MISRRVILIGGFHEVIELCEKCGRSIVGIIDNHLEVSYCGYPVLGKDGDAFNLYSQYQDCELVISPDSPQVRKKLVDYYSSIGFEFATLISPDSRISKTAVVGKGAVIQSGVNVSSATHLGRFVKLNTNCNVMHDCYISDFVTVAPNAVCLGRVSIAKSAYIGANCTVLPNLFIGDNAIVGAGAVVTKDVLENNVVVGVPAKPINE